MLIVFIILVGIVLFPTELLFRSNAPDNGAHPPTSKATRDLAFLEERGSVHVQMGGTYDQAVVGSFYSKNGGRSITCYSGSAEGAVKFLRRLYEKQRFNADFARNGLNTIRGSRV